MEHSWILLVAVLGNLAVALAALDVRVRLRARHPNKGELDARLRPPDATQTPPPGGDSEAPSS